MSPTTNINRILAYPLTQINLTCWSSKYKDWRCFLILHIFIEEEKLLIAIIWIPSRADLEFDKKNGIISHCLLTKPFRCFFFMFIYRHCYIFQYFDTQIVTSTSLYGIKTKLVYVLYDFNIRVAQIMQAISMYIKKWGTEYSTLKDAMFY